MFKLIVFFLICYLLYLTAKKIIRHFFYLESLEHPQKNNGRSDMTELVRCSSCGTYISRELAIKDYKNNEPYYVCREECKEKFDK